MLADHPKQVDLTRENLGAELPCLLLPPLRVRPKPESLTLDVHLRVGGIADDEIHGTPQPARELPAPIPAQLGDLICEGEGP